MTEGYNISVFLPPPPPAAGTPPVPGGELRSYPNVTITPQLQSYNFKLQPLPKQPLCYIAKLFIIAGNQKSSLMMFGKFVVNFRMAFKVSRQFAR